MGTESLRQDGVCWVLRWAQRLRNGVACSALGAASRSHLRPHAGSDGGGWRESMACAIRTPTFPKGRGRAARAGRAPFVHHISERQKEGGESRAGAKLPPTCSESHSGGTSGKRLSDGLTPPNGAEREAPQHYAIAKSIVPSTKEAYQRVLHCSSPL